jgi:hypothetical protein
MFAGIVLFAVANYYEPDEYGQADLFEILYSLSQFVTGGFGLIVAKKYWGSKVFGKAYLALGTAFILQGIASSLFTALQMQGVPLPYPGWPDLFVAPYFILVLYHLVTCTHYLKKKLERKDKIVLITLPVSVNIIFVFALLFSVVIPGSAPEIMERQVTIGGETFQIVPAGSFPGSYETVRIDDVTYDLVPIGAIEQEPLSPIKLDPIVFSNFTFQGLNEQDPEFWNRFFAGLFYNVITTINLGWAILGATVYRGSILGNAWGLLLLGIGLISIADIMYDFETMDGTYERNGLTMPLWIFGRMLMCYGLYIHIRNL